MKFLILIILFFTLCVENIRSQSLTPVGNGIPVTSGIYSGTVTFNNEIYAANTQQIYKWNGSTWISLGISVDFAIICMYVFNNELYVGGWFRFFNGVQVNRIVRYDGLSWQSCAGGVLLDVNSTGGIEEMIEYNGELIVLGSFIQADTLPVNNIARWNGNSWNNLGSGFPPPQLASIPSMCVYNNELYVFSLISNAGGVPVNNVAKWNGTNWSGVGSGIFHWPISSTVYNGELYAGLWIPPGDSSSMIVKWDGTNWIDIEQILTDTSWNIAIEIIGFNGCLYVAGLIDTIDGVPTTNVARYDGNSWYSVDDGVNGFANFFTVLYNELYLTGDFFTSGSTVVNHVVKFVNPPNCTTGIHDQLSQQSFIDIYPNPSSKIITLKNQFIIEANSSYQIINSFGAIVNSMNYIPEEINIIDLASGIYNIIFINNGVMQSVKFIKN